jgi:hypothetical protein
VIAVVVHLLRGGVCRSAYLGDGRSSHGHQRRWTLARCGELEQPSPGTAPLSGTHSLIPSASGVGAKAALQFEGPTPMMYDLALPVMVPTAGAVVLAGVYVMSKDPGRRARAWRLIKLLLRR